MNSRLLLPVLLVLVDGGIASSLASEDYQQHIRHFASNTPPEKVRAAIQAIRKAGTNAFPALLAHMKDKEMAESSSFQGARMFTPTVGTACFELIQRQIEGDWPKGYRDYHALSAETIRDWLARHAGLSLPQLRIEAAQQSLNRAVADAPKKANSGWHKETLKFLEENLAEAKQAAAPK
jgi:hypothetical protein